MSRRKEGGRGGKEGRSGVGGKEEMKKAEKGKTINRIVIKIRYYNKKEI